MKNVMCQRMLTLEESKQLALSNNAKFKNSMLEIDASEQIKEAAFTNFFPSISAVGMTYEAQKGLFQTSILGMYNLEMLKKGTFGFVNVLQPVFAGGRIINGNRLAALGEDVNVSKNKLTQDEVLLKTEEQYWLVVSLNEKLITVNKYEEMLNSLLNQVEDAYSSGIVMKNDVLKVKLKKSEVLLNKSKLENGKKLATMAFCQYIGIPYDSMLNLTDKLVVNGTPQNYYVDNSEALLNRGEYYLLQKSVEAEDLQTKMKLGEYLPQVGIGVSGIYMKIDEAKNRTVGMVYGMVQVPISGWWEASHTLSERSLKEKEAQNNLKDNSELLLLQMEKAWQDLTDSYKQVQISEEAKLQAEENLKVNEDSYKNGLITVSDLLEAQALLLQTKNQLTDSKADYKIKLINYLITTGRNL
jgi:outer membrane protein TolC